MNKKLSTKQTILICLGSFLLVCTVVVSILTVNSFDTRSQVQGQTTPRLSNASEYLAQVNQVREKAGVQPLVIDPTLNNTAKIKADDMISKGYYDHDSPDGTTWFDFIRKYRPANTGLGENLDKCGLDIGQDIEAWINSPGHYETMTRPQFVYFGSYDTINPKDGCSVVVNQFST